MTPEEEARIERENKAVGCCCLSGFLPVVLLVVVIVAALVAKFLTWLFS